MPRAPCDMPQFSDQEIEQLAERLEAWDDPAARPAAEAWLATNPDTQWVFAEQRSLDLALRARNGRDHQLVRDAIFAAVREEAAPRAVRKSIIDAVHAEAKTRRSLLEMLRDFFRVPVWAFSVAVVVLAAVAFFWLVPRKQKPPVPSIALPPAPGTPATEVAAAPTHRNVWDWPFSVNSPWNTSVGSGAIYEPIDAPGWPVGNLTNVVLVRQIFAAGGTNTRVNLISPGEAPRPIRYPDSWTPASAPGEIFCALFYEDNLCCEMTEPVRLPSMDIRVRERNSTDVLGHGVGWSWPQPRIIGGSALGGVIRHGELSTGIRHVLAVAVNPRAINGDNGYDGHRWPGVPVAPELVAQFGDRGNLAIGSLLAIPPNVDVSTLGVGAAGPGFEIARALQDYGAYVIQTTPGEFKLIASADADLPPEIDEIARQLVPHLRLIANNSSRNLGGGGERRRHPAPPLLQTAAPAP